MRRHAVLALLVLAAGWAATLWLSPWSDEGMAADALGTTSYGLAWGAFLDPSGRAALVHSCPSTRQTGSLMRTPPRGPPGRTPRTEHRGRSR